MRDQAVVATTTADGGLSTQPIAGDLKGGVAVVVQAPHQSGVQSERNPQGGQALLHRFKALTALRAEGIGQGWRILQQSLRVFVLRVQDAQRIGAEPGLGIGIESPRPLLQPMHQRRSVGLAIL